MTITAEQIKSLRDKTGAGIMEVKKALEEARGDQAKAKEILKKKGLEKVAKRADKETAAGRVYAYVHNGGQVGAMIAVYSETDFVARSEEFEKLCKELCLQIASMKPENLKELLKQAYIRDPKKTVEELVQEYSAKFKEKIVVKVFERFAVK